MCTTCGCGHGDTRIDGVPADASGAHAYEHVHADGTVHAHPHDHDDGHVHIDNGHLNVEDGHLHVEDADVDVEFGHARPAHNPVHPHANADSGRYAYAAAPVDGHPPRRGAGMQRHQHADGTWHSHVHGGAGTHGPVARAGLAAAHAGGVPAERIVQIEQDILAKNDAFAAVNRRLLADHGIFALNLVSSPGSGKTTLLVRTIQALRERVPVAVIEGDQQTSLDADRIRTAGAKAVQINTGKGCHLDAQMIGHALHALGIVDDSLLLIENVGNLVCPAAFDLGEAHKVVILSVTEGCDKPLKYPDMFHAADLLVINKIDLLPYVQFDVQTAIEHARRVRPGLEVLRVSATTGEGFDAWLAWLERGVAHTVAQRRESIEALRHQVATLEAELRKYTASTGAP